MKRFIDVTFRHFVCGLVSNCANERSPNQEGKNDQQMQATPKAINLNFVLCFDVRVI